MANSRKRQSASDIKGVDDGQAVSPARPDAPGTTEVSHACDASVASVASVASGTSGTSVSSSNNALAIHEALRACAYRLPLHGKVAFAFSGGLDSSVLLSVFATHLGAARCVAIHIHHGLSPNADAWATFCRAQCERLGVAFRTERVDLSALNGLGVEAAARKARYQALFRQCHEADARVLMLGQHADDQAETVLLQLLRGAGLPGLAAMPQAISHADCIVLRPFLAVTRAQLEAYARDNALGWIEDESNADVRYARNALRRDVLPQLEAYFPAYRQTLARSARHAASAQALCNELAEMDWRVAAASEPFITRPDHESNVTAASCRSLPLRALQGLPPHRLTNLLRYWMHELSMPAASEGRLNEMVAQLGEGSAIQASIRHVGWDFHVYRGMVYWEPAAKGGSPRQKPVGATLASASADNAETLPDDIVAQLQAWMSNSSDSNASPQQRRSDAMAQIAWRLPTWRGDLVFRRVATALGNSSDEGDVAESRVCLSVDMSLDVLLGGQFTARPRSRGEKLRLATNRPARSLKQLFQSAGVAPWRRDVPLFCLNDAAVFVPGIGRVFESVSDAHGEQLPSGSAGAVGSSMPEPFVLLVWQPWLDGDDTPVPA